MKYLKKLLWGMVCACIFAVIFSVSAFAERQVIVWDGKTEIEAGNTYVITDTIKLREEITIPKNTKLSVKNGGSLTIYSKGSINVLGELAIARGGTILNGGQIYVKKGSAFNVYGLFQSSISANLKLSGDMTVYRQGKAEISSTVMVYTTSYVYNKGELAFHKSSDVTFSGTLNTEERSELRLQGVFTITVSGVVDVSGHITLGSNSQIRCSGIIYLRKSSSFTRFSKISITKSGKFVDERPENAYANMTVDILVDEPRVKKKGIDVSYAQGEIDWEKVAASGVDFVIIRAGRGRAGSANAMKEDDYFRQNIKGAQKYGIDVGVYFYSYASSVSEAKEEARFLLDIIDGYKIQYPVILDMEEEFQAGIGTKKLTNMIEAFFEVLMDAKYFPMFYSYKTWLEENLDMTILDKYAIWLAQLGDEVTYDGGYYIWQYSFKGKVSGIETDVDLDYCYRDFPAILEKYGLNNL